MSIMPCDLSLAETAETAALRNGCASPHCDSNANPVFRIPLCDTCARDVAYQYLAETRTAEAATPPEPVPARTALDEAGHVYFVQLGNRIKIGFSRDLPTRMRAVPHEAILGTVPGTMRDEARCHAAFGHLRTSGEWFEAAPELISAVNDMRATHGLDPI